MNTVNMTNESESTNFLPEHLQIHVKRNTSSSSSRNAKSNFARDNYEIEDENDNILVYQVHLEENRHTLKFQQHINSNNNKNQHSIIKEKVLTPKIIRKNYLFDRRKSSSASSLHDNSSCTSSSFNTSNSSRHKIEIEFGLDPLPEKDEKSWFSTNDVSIEEEEEEENEIAKQQRKFQMSPFSAVSSSSSISNNNNSNNSKKKQSKSKSSDSILSNSSSGSSRRNSRGFFKKLKKSDVKDEEELKFEYNLENAQLHEEIQSRRRKANKNGMLSDKLFIDNEDDDDDDDDDSAIVISSLSSSSQKLQRLRNKPFIDVIRKNPQLQLFKRYSGNENDVEHLEISGGNNNDYRQEMSTNNSGCSIDESSLQIRQLNKGSSSRSRGKSTLNINDNGSRRNDRSCDIKSTSTQQNDNDVHDMSKSQLQNMNKIRNPLVVTFNFHKLHPGDESSSCASNHNHNQNQSPLLVSSSCDSNNKTIKSRSLPEKVWHELFHRSSKSNNNNNEQKSNIKNSNKLKKSKSKQQQKKNTSSFLSYVPIPNEIKSNESSEHEKSEGGTSDDDADVTDMSYDRNLFRNRSSIIDRNRKMIMMMNEEEAQAEATEFNNKDSAGEVKSDGISQAAAAASSAVELSNNNNNKIENVTKIQEDDNDDNGSSVWKIRHRRKRTPTSTPRIETDEDDEQLKETDGIPNNNGKQQQHTHKKHTNNKKGKVKSKTVDKEKSNKCSIEITNSRPNSTEKGDEDLLEQEATEVEIDDGNEIRKKRDSRWKSFIGKFQRSSKHENELKSYSLDSILNSNDSLLYQNTTTTRAITEAENTEEDDDLENEDDITTLHKSQSFESMRNFIRRSTRRIIKRKVPGPTSSCSSASMISESKEKVKDTKDISPAALAFTNDTEKEGQEFNPKAVTTTSTEKVVHATETREEVMKTLSSISTSTIPPIRKMPSNFFRSFRLKKNKVGSNLNLDIETVSPFSYDVEKVGSSVPKKQKNGNNNNSAIRTTAVTTNPFDDRRGASSNNVNGIGKVNHRLFSSFYHKRKTRNSCIDHDDEESFEKPSTFYDAVDLDDVTLDLASGELKKTFDGSVIGKANVSVHLNEPRSSLIQLEEILPGTTAGKATSSSNAASAAEGKNKKPITFYIKSARRRVTSTDKPLQCYASNHCTSIGKSSYSSAGGKVMSRIPSFSGNERPLPSASATDLYSSTKKKKMWKTENSDENTKLSKKKNKNLSQQQTDPNDIQDGDNNNEQHSPSASSNSSPTKKSSSFIDKVKKLRQSNSNKAGGGGGKNSESRESVGSRSPTNDGLNSPNDNPVFLDNGAGGDSRFFDFTGITNNSQQHQHSNAIDIIQPDNHISEDEIGLASLSSNGTGAGVGIGSVNSQQRSLSISETEDFDGPFVGKGIASVDCTPSPYDRHALRYKKGDVIDIISKKPTGIWIGKANGQIGHFKFINIKILPEIGSDEDELDSLSSHDDNGSNKRDSYPNNSYSSSSSNNIGRRRTKRVTPLTHWEMEQRQTVANVINGIRKENAALLNSHSTNSLDKEGMTTSATSTTTTAALFQAQSSSTSNNSLRQDSSTCTSTNTSVKGRARSSASKRQGRPKSVGDLLRRINLEEHISVFILHGFESLDLFKELEEEDLDQLAIINPADRGKILTAVELLREFDAEQEIPPIIIPTYSSSSTNSVNCGTTNNEDEYNNSIITPPPNFTRSAIDDIITGPSINSPKCKKIVRDSGVFVKCDDDDGKEQDVDCDEEEVNEKGQKEVDEIILSPANLPLNNESSSKTSQKNSLESKIPQKINSNKNLKVSSVRQRFLNAKSLFEPTDSQQDDLSKRASAPSANGGLNSQNRLFQDGGDKNTRLLCCEKSSDSGISVGANSPPHATSVED